MSKHPSVTLIAGPTASGKSALALKMARETEAVIINADSQQLYADLRVLTARPSVEDESIAEHRLYGVADAGEAWSVGRWNRAVLAELDELNDRPAIVVGGTGLYFMALTQGLAEIPPVSTAMRNAVETDFLIMGETKFRAELAVVDPIAEARIERGDRQRLIRALSVWKTSGRALSQWQADTRPLLEPGSWTGEILSPDRPLLYARCDLRAEAMLAQGALEEVHALMSRALPAETPAMKAVGVREIMAFLRAEMSFEEARTALKQATRNYAKRQMTWFRNQMPDWRKASL